MFFCSLYLGEVLGIVVRCLGLSYPGFEIHVWSRVYLFLMERGRGLGLSSTILWLDESRTTKFSAVKSKRMLRLWILFFNDGNWPI